MHRRLVLLSRRVGRVFGTPPSVGWALVVGFGLVVSATLTPLRDGLDLGTTGVGTCDLSRIGSLRSSELLRIGDTSLNVLLFIPLGFAVGLVPGSRRRNVLAAIAVLSPLAIESTQLVLPVLGRGCQSADVFDNLTGLVLGWVIGAGLADPGGGIVPPADSALAIRGAARHSPSGSATGLGYSVPTLSRRIPASRRVSSRRTSQETVVGPSSRAGHHPGAAAPHHR